MSAPVNILVITYWKLNDALIRTYTLPYLRIMREILPPGSEITLVTLEPEGEIRIEKEIEPGIINLPFRLYPFGFKAMISWNSNLRIMEKLVRKKHIRFIHTWCTPAGVIGYRLSKATGLPLILDSFEPHAEPMVETGTWMKGGVAFRTLFSGEKKQVHHATWLIGVVKAMQEYARVKYRYNGNNFLAKPACIDTEHFHYRKRNNVEVRKELGFTDEIVCVYAGKFGGLYMKEEAFRFFKAARDVFGEKFRVLLLTSAHEREIAEYCRLAGLGRHYIKTAFVPHERVPDYLGVADFAFSAFKPVPSRRYCTPIKNGEYWGMGLPVVIADGISDDSEIIRDTNSGYVLNEISEAGFSNAAHHIQTLLQAEDRVKLAERIHGLAEKHRNFALARSVYEHIYAHL